MPPKDQLDPGIIERAPIEPGSQLVAPAEPADQLGSEYIKIIGELSARLEEAEAENERLTGELDIDQVKATMLKPYVNKVFWFVVFYCVFVGSALSLDGWHVGGFKLSDTVLGIISGSTAVSVIGLIGMVITGLFGSAKKA